MYNSNVVNWENVEMPRNIQGAPVRGEDLFDRARELAKLETCLEIGSALLLAPRRYGKTSILQELVRRDPRRRRYFDLYHVSRASSFVTEIAADTAGPVARVRDWIADVLGKTLDRIESVQIDEIAVELRRSLEREDRWSDALLQMLSTFGANDVLVFDEFPVMLKAIHDKDRQEAIDLLRLLRHVRQADGAPRFIFAGSTSLPRLVADIGAVDAINDLTVVSLDPFDETVALALLAAVFETEQVPATAGVCRAIVSCVGPEVPFFLHLLAGHVKAEWRDYAKMPTPRRIRERLYQESMLGPEGRVPVEDFRARLDRVYTPAERDVAFVLLGELSRERGGLTMAGLRGRVVDHGLDDALVERVLALLADDFYIAPSQGWYRFFNRFMADWWRRYFAD
ncbi:MAG TPA: hypothetical protein VIR57_13430 [Chloroflexota bacterium]|jgi:hypothetical protein